MIWFHHICSTSWSYYFWDFPLINTHTHTNHRLQRRKMLLEQGILCHLETFRCTLAMRMARMRTFWPRICWQNVGKTWETHGKTLGTSGKTQQHTTKPGQEKNHVGNRLKRQHEAMPLYPLDPPDASRYLQVHGTSADSLRDLMRSGCPGATLWALQLQPGRILGTANPVNWWIVSSSCTYHIHVIHLVDQTKKNTYVTYLTYLHGSDI